MIEIYSHNIHNIQSTQSRFQDNWSVPGGSPLHNSIQQQQQQQQQQMLTQIGFSQQQPHPFSQPQSLPPASPMHPQHHHQSTQMFTNENLPPLQQQQSNQNNLTNTEMLHQSFLMMNGALPPQPQQQPSPTKQTTPNLKQQKNPNIRCQSVPAVAHHTRQPQTHQPAAYQPLTPQLNRMSRMSNNDENGEPINAKRNLNFMFDQLPPGNLNINHSNSNNNNNNRSALQINAGSSHDRLVPTSILQRVNNNSGVNGYNQQLLETHDQQPATAVDQDNLFGDLAFPLNDISSPDDLEDIQLDKMDGTEGDDDLLKSISNNNNTVGHVNDGGVSSSWVNDWSNATLPVMNVS